MLRGREGRQREREILFPNIFLAFLLLQAFGQKPVLVCKIYLMLRMKNKLSGFVWTKVMTLSGLYCSIYFFLVLLSLFYFSLLYLSSLSLPLFFSSFSIFAISLLFYPSFSLLSLFFSSCSLIT